jgi:hypothetical protein
LPTPATIATDNADYKEVTDYLAKTIDIKQKPCENFYDYTCKKLGGQTSNAQLVNLNVAKMIAQAIPNLDKVGLNFLLGSFRKPKKFLCEVAICLHKFTSILLITSIQL